MIHGLRVHIAGSAAPDCPDGRLAAAHAFVRRLTVETIDQGAGLVAGVGGDPSSESGLPCLFDWPRLEVVAGLQDPAPAWPPDRRERFVVVASQRGLEKIPDHRRDVWTVCTRRSDFTLQTTEPGWRMAGIIREQQVFWGDVLVVIGGGAGTEHLAQLYRAEGKPVIPIHADLGAMVQDGRGGSRFLFEQALADANVFFELADGAGNSAARLTDLRLTDDSDGDALAGQVTALIRDLRPPRAFFVRLVAEDHPDYEDVEVFFRDVVNPVIEERGFLRHQVGLDRPEAAFMNVEIFDILHRAAFVVVDLTALRPNCLIELGYALGRRRHVLVAARKGTVLPFDEDKIPTLLWSTEGSLDDRRTAFRDWLDRYRDMPPVVDA